MNEELITTLANNIIGVTFFSFVGGVVAGWYATFAHYRQIERERKAVSDYISDHKTKIAPPTELEKVQKAMDTLHGIVTRYHIEWEGTEWNYIDETD